jgi:hypothetical protein
MIGIGPIGEFLAGVIAIALATPVLAAALFEQPPAERAPRALIRLAGSWCALFAGAAVVFAVVGPSSDRLAVCGLLVAAAELAGGATAWFARSGSGKHGDGGGGWGRDDPRPHAPAPGGLPDEYWLRWEADLAGVSDGVRSDGLQ